MFDFIYLNSAYSQSDAVLSPTALWSVKAMLTPSSCNWFRVVTIYWPMLLADTGLVPEIGDYS